MGFPLCKYAKMNNCTECNYSYKLKCKLFNNSHLKFLCKDIVPFRFDKGAILTSKMSIVSNLDQAKSLSLRASIETNSPVFVINTNQLLSLTLTNEPLDKRVLLVNLTSVQGERTKISAVIQSFLDIRSMNNSYYTIVFNPNNSGYKLNA